MSYKINEWVLVSNGNYTYTPRKIVGIRYPGKLLISFGAYAAEYSESSVHKCPKSLVPTEQS